MASPAAATNAASNNAAAPQGKNEGKNVNGSLYVGDLPTDVTENNLYELFSKVGMVMSIKVCRDINTNRSLGYAYVNFQNPQDAERALETMNYTTINGKAIRIMWSQRDPTMRKGGNGNVFIKNLDSSIDNRALYDTFSVFGNILSCKVVTDEDKGESKGYGFVHFEQDDAAKEAISRVNNMLMNGKAVTVGPFVKRVTRLQEHEKTFTAVYVKQLHKDMTDDSINAFCKKHGGEAESIFLSEHNEHSTKFALIEFKEHESAVKFIDETNGNSFDGVSAPERTLSTCRALKKRDRLVEVKQQKAQATREQLLERQGRNVYVKHFDDDVSEDNLRELFAAYGTISSCVIMRDNTKNSRGFGFVCFEKKEAADVAIRELNNKVVWRRPLYVSLAQVKDQRRRELDKVQQMNQRNAFMGGGGGYNPMANAGMFGFPNMGFPAPNPNMRNFAAGRGGMPMGFGRGMGGMGVYGMPGMMNAQMRGGGGRGGMPGVMPGRGGRPPQQSMVGKQQPRYTQNPQVRPTPVQQSQTAASDLNLNQLSSMTPEEQKNTLGEKLYSRIMASHPQQAAKITGMLLEMETPEILNILEDTQSLNSKIEEALAVLKAHEEKK